MNKHTKLAIMVAPFLSIGGYVATDYYQQYQKNQKRYHTISIQGNCHIQQGKCLLKGAGLLLEYSQMDGLTTLKANYPLDSAIITMVNDQFSAKKAAPHHLKPDNKRKNWTIQTAHYAITNPHQGNKIRLVILANDHLFFSEFGNIMATIVP